MDLVAENARLRAALAPLAEMAARYDPDDDDGELECWSGLAVPRIKHLRAARAALATPAPDVVQEAEYERGKAETQEGR